MSRKPVVPQLTVQQAKALAAGRHVEHIPYDSAGLVKGWWCIACGDPWPCIAARNGEQEVS